MINQKAVAKYKKKISSCLSNYYQNVREIHLAIAILAIAILAT